MKSRNIALVPLRGGSKSIPKKNIKMIGGQPLCAWTLQAASNAHRIEKVYVSTDCNEIKNVVSGLDMNVRIIDRPPELATDEATTESVMLHFMEAVPPFDCLVTIQATSPLLKSWHLDEALEEFEVARHDSLLSVVRTKRFFWQDDGTPLNYDPLCRPRRQDFPGILLENGAFYITKSSLLANSKCRLGGNIGFYEMPEESATEIDEPCDWDVAERQLKKSNSRCEVDN
jgi:N-acylneuraminate cytidylyltransferase